MEANELCKKLNNDFLKQLKKQSNVHPEIAMTKAIEENTLNLNQFKGAKTAELVVKLLLCHAMGSGK